MVTIIKAMLFTKVQSINANADYDFQTKGCIVRDNFRLKPVVTNDFQLTPFDFHKSYVIIVIVAHNS